MQKFIIRVTEENTSLIGDSAAECFLLDSAMDKEFNRRFAAEAKQAGKLVLSGGEQGAELCKELELDGVIADMSKNENPKPNFSFCAIFWAKTPSLALSPATAAMKRWLSANSNLTS